MAIIDKALTMARDRKALEKRLRSARNVLMADLRKLFGKGRFDYTERRLVGNNGLILQWRTRRMPHLSVSYRNQQTSEGEVTLTTRS